MLTQAVFVGRAAVHRTLLLNLKGGELSLSLHYYEPLHHMYIHTHIFACLGCSLLFKIPMWLSLPSTTITNHHHINKLIDVRKQIGESFNFQVCFERLSFCRYFVTLFLQLFCSAQQQQQFILFLLFPSSFLSLLLCCTSKYLNHFGIPNLYLIFSSRFPRLSLMSFYVAVVIQSRGQISPYGAIK